MWLGSEQPLTLPSEIFFIRVEASLTVFCSSVFCLLGGGEVLASIAASLTASREAMEGAFVAVGALEAAIGKLDHQGSEEWAPKGSGVRGQGGQPQINPPKSAPKTDQK